MSFWQEQTKPIIGLSPMDGITDEPMRFITAKYGRPGVIFTEFINVEYAACRPEKLLERFLYSDIERPIVAQISGIDTDLFYQFTFAAAYLGFDGVDINMGCPSKSVTSRGGGAALIGDYKLVRELVSSAYQAIGDWQEGKKIDAVILNKNVLSAIKKIDSRNHRLGVKKKSTRPVGLSVKTRLGIKEPLIKDWLGFLVSLPLDAITVHGRTLAQKHSGLVDWPALSLAAKIAHQQDKIFLGNGSVGSLAEAKIITKQYGLDGVLIGRGAIGNPGIFSNRKPDKKDQLKAMMDHACYYLDLFGQDNFLNLRKHLGRYPKGFPGARRLRAQLVRTSSYRELEEIIGVSNT